MEQEIKKDDRPIKIRKILNIEKNFTNKYDEVFYVFKQSIDPFVIDNSEIELIVNMLRQQKDHINDTIESKIVELRKINN